MRKKIFRLMLLSIILLVVFYSISYMFFLKYERSKSLFETTRKNLVSTDLSELYFEGLKVGDTLGLVPEAFKGIIACENGKSYADIGGMVETEKADSKINRINAELPIDYQITYKGIKIDDVDTLLTLLGKNYIYDEVNNYGDEHVSKIFIDNEHDIELYILINSHIIVKKVDIPLYNINIQSNIFKSYNWYSPISILTSLRNTWNKEWHYGWNFGFKNFDLFILPLYLIALIIPILSLIIYRNKRILVANIFLIILYFCLYLAYWFNLSMGV